jgi:phosphorylcholine metabolism protein LicD
VIGRTTLMRHGPGYLGGALAAGREAGITPFLMWGTLLGCVRDGDFVSHDHDIDLGIRSGDYARKNAFVAAMPRHGYLVDWDAPYKIRFSRRWRGLHIDVDVFYPWDEKLICCVRLGDGSLSGESFASDAFDNRKQVRFVRGLSAHIPDPPEPVLAAIYGDWQTPRPDYRSMTGALNRIAFVPGQEISILGLNGTLEEDSFGEARGWSAK